MWVVSLAVAVPAFGSKTLSLSLSLNGLPRDKPYEYILTDQVIR